jgi:acetyl-CoA carboxylase carboxyltransferase component
MASRQAEQRIEPFQVLLAKAPNERIQELLDHGAFHEWNALYRAQRSA